MELYLVRHGEVVPPAPGAFYGGAEVPLSATGREQAEAAAALLGGVRLDAIYSSPLSRARFGAERVAERQGLEVRERVELREIDRGRWTGHTKEQIEARWPGQLAAHDADLEGWRGNGGETFGDLRDRVVPAVEEVIGAHPGGAVAVVCHLFPIRAVLAQVLGVPLEGWTQLRLPTGSVSLVEVGGAGLEQAVVRWHGRRGDDAGDA
jgi:broad specificity phosphatase PhoE